MGLLVIRYKCSNLWINVHTFQGSGHRHDGDLFGFFPWKLRFDKGVWMLFNRRMHADAIFLMPEDIKKHCT